MGNQRQPSDRVTELEAWWAFLARVFSFLLGAGIMVWQTVLEQADRPWLIAAGLGLMGLPIVNVFSQLIGARNGRDG